MFFQNPQLLCQPPRGLPRPLFPNSILPPPLGHPFLPNGYFLPPRVPPPPGFPHSPVFSPLVTGKLSVSETSVYIIQHKSIVINELHLYIHVLSYQVHACCVR